MTDNAIPPEAPKSGGPNNALIYGLCVVAGLVFGVAGTLLVTGGGAGGDDPVVATLNGKDIRASEAFAQNKTQLFGLEEQLYNEKERAVNDYIDNKLIDAEAAKQKVTTDQLLEKELGPVAEGDITDAEVEAFMLARGIPSNDPRVRKEDVRDFLKFRKRIDKKTAYVAKLRTGANVKLKLSEPSSPKIEVATDGFPSWGNPKAPVTIAIFSDFQCPFCSRAVPTIDRIKKEYGPDKVRIVFMDMPLPNHPRAEPAAIAGRCANEQGKFWEFHDVVFANQAKLEDADLETYAKQVGLDDAKFKECYADKKRHEASITKSKKEAEKASIQATPSFVVNGSLVQGAQPFEKFKEKIDRGLKG